MQRNEPGRAEAEERDHAGDAGACGEAAAARVVDAREHLGPRARVALDRVLDRARERRGADHTLAALDRHKRGVCLQEVPIGDLGTVGADVEVLVPKPTRTLFL